LFGGSKGQIFLELRHNQSAVPECVMHDFQFIGGRGPFEDPNFAFLTVRTNFVCKFCSPRHLHNIREIQPHLRTVVLNKVGTIHGVG
jgi:hypothetical protein